MVSEKDIEVYLKNRANQEGMLCYKFTSPAKRAVPDRILLYRSKTYYVELKSPVGVLSKLQEREIGIMRKSGADVSVVNSLEGVNELLERIKGEWEDGAKRLSEESTG